MYRTLSLVLVICGAVTLAGCDAPQKDVATPEVVSEPVEEYVVDSSDLLVTQNILDFAESELDAQERADLILMREEEKLARDVYITLGEKWGQKIFHNIAQSEQTHTDAVKGLLDRYDISDPVQDDTVGVFQDQRMQQLYDDLVAQRSKSLLEALIIGATIEDLDIKDLQEMIARTDNQDIQNVYENLMRGSRNHMRAFDRQITMRGGEYEAQYLTQEEIDEILAGEQERGSHGGGNGKNGNGGGRNR